MATRGGVMFRKWFRSHSDQSQNLMAQQLGVSQPSISAWLAGRSRPDLANLFALQHLIGIPLDAWLTRQERDRLARLREWGPSSVGSVRPERHLATGATGTDGEA
jgi:transcriptional regulator with XRE-family HTH domain